MLSCQAHATVRQILLPRLQSEVPTNIWKNLASEPAAFISCILLDRAGVTTLTLSHIKTIAAEVYKASNDLSPLYIADMFCPRANLLTLPKLKTVKYGKNSLLFEGVKIWNHLPNDIRSAQNFPAFKNFCRFGMSVTVQYAPYNFFILLFFTFWLWVLWLLPI